MATLNSSDQGYADVSIIDIITNEEENMYSPLIIFILICLFCLFGVVIYKSTTSQIPSVCTIGTQIIFMIFGCAILLVTGSFNVEVEWICLVVITLSILFSSYAILEPNVFFYPELS